MVDELTKRWIRSPADEKAAARGCWFSQKKADHVVEFFEKHLRHTIGRWAGKPLILLPWQRDEVLRPLFGWQTPEGKRRYRQAYIEIPKKNGKSVMCSGIALYLLAADGEEGSQVFCAAADREQAGIVYREASAMAKASPLLKNYIIPRDSVKNLAIPSANSFLRAISRESFTAEGLNIHGLIFDELHAQRSRELWDALRYGGSAREQPLHVSITTAGYDRSSICYEVHERAKKIIDNVIEDESFFAYILAADPKDDWKDPEVWKRVNPSLGTIISMEEMEQACREAIDSPTQENTFKRYRLNIWTEQANRFIPMDKWDECAGSVNPEELLRVPCFGGIDLADIHDLNAFVLIFPLPDGRTKVLPWFWTPDQDIMGREMRDGVPYSLWARNGHLELTSGSAADYRLIYQRIVELSKKFNVQGIGIDPWNAQDVGNRLIEEAGLRVEKVPQTFSHMSNATKEFERLIQSGQLVHGNNPVLNWMASNVSVAVRDTVNQRPIKTSKTERIDGIVATIIAIAVSQAMGGSTDSIYDVRREILTI